MLLGVGVLTLVAGCAYTKEFVPIQVQPAGVRVPNQQRLVAKSASEAVKQACTKLNLKQYAGKSVRVEINGVFPHSADDLLNYVATAVEAEAAAAGLMVLPRPDPHFVPQVIVNSSPPPRRAEMPLPVASAEPPGHKFVGKERPPQPAPQPSVPAAVVEAPAAAPEPTAPPVAPWLPPEQQPADLRLVVSVDWGGMDVRDEKFLKEWPLLGQIGLGGLGLAGIIGGAAGNNGTVTVAGTIGLVGAVVWQVFDSSMDHTYTLDGRVQLTLRTIPHNPREPVGIGIGNGESRIVVDPKDQYGYQPNLVVPKP
jgi:hypothetical protein